MSHEPMTIANRTFSSFTASKSGRQQEEGVQGSAPKGWNAAGRKFRVRLRVRLVQPLAGRPDFRRVQGQRRHLRLEPRDQETAEVTSG